MLLLRRSPQSGPTRTNYAVQAQDYHYRSYNHNYACQNQTLVFVLMCCVRCDV